MVSLDVLIRNTFRLTLYRADMSDDTIVYEVVFSDCHKVERHSFDTYDQAKSCFNRLAIEHDMVSLK